MKTIQAVKSYLWHFNCRFKKSTFRYSIKRLINDLFNAHPSQHYTE